MADNTVSFVLNHLSQLVASEAKLLCGVEDSIQSLRNELQMINEFLKASKANKGIQKTVVNQIRDVAHLAEDVIDTYVAKVAHHNSRTMLRRMLHGVDQAISLHHVANKIDKIKTTLNEIRDNKIKYHEFQERNKQSTTEEEEEKVEGMERAQSLHKLRRNVEEEHVVGFGHDSKVLIEQLMEGGSRRSVISIIGMGGLGKTTLARKVYNSAEVKRCFRCSAWVYVSNECRTRELLLSLLKHFMPNPAYVRQGTEKHARDISTLSEDELKKLLRECLEWRRYLVVLDDLWKTQDWDEVQDAFPDNNLGSRILITSRLKEVASHTSLHPPYHLQFLSEEESWALFCKKVFRGQDYPSDLEALGKKIVKSCRGLPLSIVVLAGLLANKEKSHREWSKVVGHVNWYLTQDQTQVKDTLLKLSYHNLPTRLKPCFLYLGIFPEDFEIPVRPLLQRWVAEGFIQETGNRDPYDVAEDYLYELIDRSLVQVARVKFSGGVKTCRIHDLLRDLCISESKEDKVFEVCTDKNIRIPTKPRRLSVHCNMRRYISSSNNDHSCIRSMFFFDTDNCFIFREWKRLFKSFKLVRVLDLEIYSAEKIKIPSNLGDFIHLRYLKIVSELSYCDFRTIPASILTLPYLETLDFGYHKILFPDGIWKLKHLRHLYGSIVLPGGCSGSKEIMWNLQNITTVDAGMQITYLIEKGSLPNLKKLGLRFRPVEEDILPKLLHSLQQLSHLNGLTIYFFGYVDSREVSRGLGQLSHITSLRIDNAFDLLMCEVTFPPNVTKLMLTNINYITDEGMDALGNLTKLQSLRLYGQTDKSPFDLNCVAGKFPQLQVFQMKYLEVQNWKLTYGAMSCLQSLFIDKCQVLHGLPNELWSLTSLRRVEVSRPSREMVIHLRHLEINECELVVLNDYNY